ncbi:IPT/TIG domain-containing protein, partial [Endothiovibrio diazotrophicus]
MTARAPHRHPLLRRLGALLALFALTAAAHAAWPLADDGTTTVLPIDDARHHARLIDVAMDNRHQIAVALAADRRAFLLGPAGTPVEEIALPAWANTLAIDPERQLALIGTDRHHGLLLLDLQGRALLADRIPTGQAIDTLAAAPGLAIAAQKNRDTLHFIDLEQRRSESLRLRHTRLAGLAVHHGRGQLYAINRQVQSDDNRRDRGGNANNGNGNPNDNGNADDSGDGRGDDQGDDREDDEDHDGHTDNEPGHQGELLVLDLASRQLTARLPLSRHADSLVLDEQLDLAAVSLGSRKRLQVVRLADGAVVNELPFNQPITALALQPRTHRLLITLANGDRTALLDLATGTLTNPYAPLTRPRAAAVSERYNLALVISGRRNESLELLPLPAPTPELTALTPEQAITGDPLLAAGLDLTLTGGPFFDGAALLFGDDRYPAQWEDYDRLTAHLPAESLTRPAVYDVRVENPHPSDGPSAALPFTVLDPNPVPQLDAVAPATLELTDPPGPATLTLSGSGFIEASVAYLGAQPLATTRISDTALAATIPASLLAEPGEAVLTLFNPAPGGGTSAPLTIHLESPGPRIDAFTPAEGPAGTLVTITGRNFDALTPANNRILFGASATPAAIAYADATTLRAVVPLDAQSGPIALTTADGEATSAEPFTLQQQEAFAIQAAPAATTLTPGGQAYVMVQLQSLGLSEYRQPIQLAIDGLPDGLTAAFTAGSLTLRRPATLILTADPEAAAGDFAFTVTATGREGQTEVTRTAPLQATILPAGTTTVVGRILNAADDHPMAGVGVQLGDAYTTTDAAGFYLFTDPPLTGDQVVLIDGGTLNTPTTQYPSRIAMPVMIEPGQQNPVLTSYLSAIDTANKVTITPGVGTDVTFEALPNFALHIPDGATLTGWDGTPITEINVRTASPDRLPIKPLPDGVTATTIYLYYFFRAGGAHPSEPIPVTMPNELGLAPGEHADLWYYDESPVPDPTSNQWRRQGSATVSADGMTISTDPGVGIPKFCCGASTFVPRTFDPAPPCGGPKAGNPVDLATGSGSVFEDHSLGINGLFPVRLTCGYGSTAGTGNQAGPFGPGTWLNTEWFLQAGASGTLGLTTPNGALYAFTADGPDHYRIAPGNRPEAFGISARYGSRASTGHVEFPNGTTFEFDMSEFQTGMADWKRGYLVRVINPAGTSITITRDGQTKRPTSITDGAGRPYLIEYNEYGYVDAITDPAGRTQHYHYKDYAYSVISFPGVVTSGMLTGTMVLASIEDYAGHPTSYRWNRDFGKNIEKRGGKTKPTFSVIDDKGRVTEQFFGGIEYHQTTTAPCSSPVDYPPLSTTGLPFGLEATRTGTVICTRVYYDSEGYRHVYYDPYAIYAVPHLVEYGHHHFDYRT